MLGNPRLVFQLVRHAFLVRVFQVANNRNGHHIKRLYFTCELQFGSDLFMTMEGNISSRRAASIYSAICRYNDVIICFGEHE